jgi:protoheme IX farnesyltransferase
MIGTSLSRQHENFLQVIQSYYQLTKPRIIPLLVITTAAGMWLASDGEVDPLLLLATVVGGTLAAASAQTLNCIYDRDIDYDMERTRHRPIPSVVCSPVMLYYLRSHWGLSLSPYSLYSPTFSVPS